jgi:hypothetical protein
VEGTRHSCQSRPSRNVWTTAPVNAPVPMKSGYGQYTRRNDASGLPQNVTQFYTQSAGVRGRLGGKGTKYQV